MTKIGVISDTHLAGSNERLKLIARRFFSDVDLVLHAGDLVDINVLDAFCGKKVKAVCGNMDPPSVVKVLPKRLILDIDGFKIGLMHGWGTPSNLEDDLLKALGKVDCLVYGHTHNPANSERGGILFFNPGSAADKRFCNANSVGIIEIDRKITGKIIELNDIPGF
ncbi:MAG: YfcE family phosphodiesterase [Syntrophobacteraceae bacterium CG23_combo_of_CG06-09_8_20_14_all_50_8]|nr:MAG: YfcE family phosphodiesterase [Syntrophobacteraceae bacterium CG23_combo_of_CG06-09_8_20_14_all_50_8]